MTAGKPVDEQREATSTDNGVDVNCAKAKHRTLAQTFSSDDVPPATVFIPAQQHQQRCRYVHGVRKKRPATESNLSISPKNDLAQIVQKQVSIWKFFQ